MDRDIVKELILKSLLDEADTIVLVMPKSGHPLIATSLRCDYAELANRIRGWAGLLENSIRNNILVGTGEGVKVQ